MKDTLASVKSYAGAISGVLMSVIGLLVIAQVVFGEGSIDVIGNLQNIVNGFVGEGASLAGIITLLIIVGLVTNNKDK